MSSAGSRRRSSNRPLKSFSSAAWLACSSAAWRSPLMPSSALPIEAPYRANSSAFASGTPSRSVITAIGSGAANWETRSNSPADAAWSSMRPTVCSIRPR